MATMLPTHAPGQSSSSAAARCTQAPATLSASTRTVPCASSSTPPGGRRNHEGGAVVLADGGFPADLDAHAARDDGRRQAAAAQRRHRQRRRATDGECRRAATVGMKAFDGRLLSRDALTNVACGRGPTWARCGGRIVADPTSALRRRRRRRCLPRQRRRAAPGSPGHHARVRQRDLERAGRESARSRGPHLPQAGGPCTRRRTIRELAARSACPPTRCSPLCKPTRRRFRDRQHGRTGADAARGRSTGLAHRRSRPLRRALVRGHHQHDGRHRGRWRRCSAGPARRTHSQRLCRGRATGGLEGGPASRLRRRPGEARVRPACGRGHCEVHTRRLFLDEPIRWFTRLVRHAAWRRPCWRWATLALAALCRGAGRSVIVALGGDALQRTGLRAARRATAASSRSSPT